MNEREVLKAQDVLGPPKPDEPLYEEPFRKRPKSCEHCRMGHAVMHKHLRQPEPPTLSDKEGDPISNRLRDAFTAGVAAGREAQRKEDAEIAQAKEEWASRNIINSRSSTDGDDRWDVGYQHAAATIAAAILRGGKP